MWTAEAEDGFAELLTELLEIPAQWRGRPQTVVAGASATIDPISDSGIGQPETEFVLEAGMLTPTVYGLNEATVQVSVWSPSQAAGQSARMYTSRLRTRLGFGSTIEALRALGIGIVRVGEAQVADVVQTGRDRSGSILELRLSFGTAEADAAVPYVDTVRVYTTDDAPGIENVEGTVLPDSVQIDINPPAP